MDSPSDLFEQASAAWDAGNSRQAFKLFLQAAKLGNAGAQLNVGHFYDAGEAVRQNRTNALYWYKQAWKTGQLTSACSNIAQTYAEAGNRRMALHWWKRAIDHGDGDAALDVAKFHLRGGKVRLPDAIASLLKSAASSSRVTPDAAEEARLLLRVFFGRSE